jgi:predicted dehydrogenase
LLGEGCHFIDFLTFLAGAAPISVSSMALPGDGAPQDNLQVTMQFPDGSLGTLAYLSNGDRSLPKERLEVFCGGKVAVLEDFQSLQLTEDGRTRRMNGRQDKGHQAIWAAFLSSLKAGGAPPIAYEQLFGGTRAVFAALRSLESGRAEEV